MVVDIVLSTDIASPERMQLTKSKFDEAFGKMLNKKKRSNSNSKRSDNSSSNDDNESIKVHKVNRRKDSNFRRGTSLPSDMSQRSSIGIRRTLDFSGLAISPFSNEKQLNNMENGDNQSNEKNLIASDNDKSKRMQDDPLKAQVILELMIRIADIGATMQSFENFTLWGRRLYFEQKAAFETGRGVDPDSFWLDGQITFLDSYAKQLAKSIQDINAFSDVDNIFAFFVEENKKKWSELGVIMTTTIQEDWKQERLKMNLKHEGFSASED